MKLRKTDPWKPASDYSRELIGLTVNLLVNNISKATQFSAKDQWLDFLQLILLIRSKLYLHEKLY